MKHIATLLLLFTLSAAYGQGHLFSRVKLNRSSVYVGQPVEVTVSVYSSTWFTSGVDPGNIKVEGAFTVYFRSVSQTEKINGKTYAGVDMIFNVFPFEDKDIEFPAVTFHVETPDEGDYKGKPKTVRTKPRKIKVKPIPPGYDKAAWVVTTGLWVNERWSGNLQNVKIGDVLERRIDRTVSNTVSELIPPVVWDSVENIALYPMRPEVMNQKTKTDISASRTDGMRYLFLEEGEVTIPGQVFTWYNPYRKRLYKKTLKARTINVLPNPDLGMLKTVRDSLAMMSTPPQSGEEKQDSTILGMSYKQFAFALISFLVFAITHTFIFIRLGKAIIRKRKQYLNSERYFFNQFKKALRSKDPVRIFNALYLWLDSIKFEGHTATEFAMQFGGKVALEEVSSLEEATKNNNSLNSSLNTSVWSVARKRYFASQSTTKQSMKPAWINP